MTLETPYQQYMHQSKYARWDDEKGRRETWEETVDRYMDHMNRQALVRGRGFTDSEYQELRLAILNQEILPSMRALMTAGKALTRDNVAAYNCAYLSVDYVRAFAETLYILCCGTGVGYSVESKFVDKLPVVADDFHSSPSTITVADSKIGWATAFDELIRLLYAGKVPNLNYDLVRPAGARLKTFGGRASGPGPLKALFEHTIEVFKNSAGRRLTPFEVHSIMCKIGEVIVAGGVRRSALISLFDPSDTQMLFSKDGEWYKENPHLRLANNSAVYDSKPSKEEFDEFWKIIQNSGSGEPGVISREALNQQIPERRDPNHIFGVNPCAEIILRSRQFCNLTTVVLRPSDAEETIARKVRLATVLGTIQASFTDFRFLGREWKANCDEEALLGVSFMGIMDHPLMNGAAGGLAARLEKLRKLSRSVNESYAELWDLNPAAAIGCVKPDGNGGQFAGASSGIHGAYDHFWIRRSRESKLSPVGQLLHMQGVHTETDLYNEGDYVFSWPQKAPE
jgi:ribonucleoside-triphosphate reductase